MLDVQISSQVERTTASLELGAALTVHRQRVPRGLTMDIIVSDVESEVGDLLLGFHERDRARKAEAMLDRLQASPDGLRIFHRGRFVRTPAGERVWVLDNWTRMDVAPEVGVLRASLSFGEQPRFGTFFESALDGVVEEFSAEVDPGVDRGRQSTVEVPDAVLQAIQSGII